MKEIPTDKLYKEAIKEYINHVEPKDRPEYEKKAYRYYEYERVKNYPKYWDKG